MTLPVLESGWDVQQSASGRTSVPFNQPSGSQTDDLLMAICIDDDPGASSNWNVKTGWTRQINIGNGTSDSKLAIYWRIQDGTESWPESFTASTSRFRGGVMLRITGIDTVTPIHVTRSSAAVLTNSYSILGPTTTIDDCLILYGFAFDGGDGVPYSVSGTGWSEFQEIQNGTGGPNGSGCMGQRDLASKGASGTALIACNVSDGCIGAQIAIAPAAAAGGGLVGSLAGEGGLAGMGGLAGQSGGLAG